jgi:hypothetical protein
VKTSNLTMDENVFENRELRRIFGPNREEYAETGLE